MSLLEFLLKCTLHLSNHLKSTVIFWRLNLRIPLWKDGKGKGFFNK